MLFPQFFQFWNFWCGNSSKKYGIYGQPIDERFIFIAACNPYRRSGNENNLLNVLYKQNYKRKNLVYTVNPLPMPLLNFIFNFGSLTKTDEQSYIRNMVVSPVENFYWKEIDQNKEKKPEPKKEENNNEEDKKIRIKSLIKFIII